MRDRDTSGSFQTYLEVAAVIASSTLVARRRWAFAVRVVIGRNFLAVFSEVDVVT